jgi:hypothetical protein
MDNMVNIILPQCFKKILFSLEPKLEPIVSNPAASPGNVGLGVPLSDKACA